jgi:hypothetical protein
MSGPTATTVVFIGVPVASVDFGRAQKPPRYPAKPNVTDPRSSRRRGEGELGWRMGL